MADPNHNQCLSLRPDQEDLDFASQHLSDLHRDQLKVLRDNYPDTPQLAARYKNHSVQAKVSDFLYLKWHLMTLKFSCWHMPLWRIRGLTGAHSTKRTVMMYVCTACPSVQRFDRHDRAAEHLVEAHKRLKRVENSSQLICTECGETLSTSSKALKHLAREHGVQSDAVEEKNVPIPPCSRHWDLDANLNATIEQMDLTRDASHGQQEAMASCTSTNPSSTNPSSTNPSSIRTSSRSQQLLAALPRRRRGRPRLGEAKVRKQQEKRLLEEQQRRNEAMLDREREFAATSAQVVSTTTSTETALVPQAAAPVNVAVTQTAFIVAPVRLSRATVEPRTEAPTSATAPTATPVTHMPTPVPETVHPMITSLCLDEVAVVPSMTSTRAELPVENACTTLLSLKRTTTTPNEKTLKRCLSDISKEDHDTPAAKVHKHSNMRTATRSLLQPLVIPHPGEPVKDMRVAARVAAAESMPVPHGVNCAGSPFAVSNLIIAPMIGSQSPHERPNWAASETV